jgi:peptidoglycan/LPS O-acetylase OafA/YrhL
LLALGALLVFRPMLSVDHVLIVLLAGMLGGVASGNGTLAALLSTRPLRAVGAASYALYIVHWLIFEMLWWAFDRLGLLVGSMAGWLFFVALIALSLVAAFALHVVIERPARRTLRRLAEGERAG